MKILIPYDGSRNSLAAMRLLAGMALNPHSEILILKVVPTPTGFLGFGDDPVENQEVLNNQSIVLRELAKELAKWQKGCNINFRIHFGSPAESILDVADEWESDLIILGPRRPDKMQSVFMGSVSKEVVAKSHCPVMIVRPPANNESTPRTFENGYKVLVPIDGSLYSYYTINWLSSQVWKQGTEIKILTAIPEFKDAFDSMEVQYDTSLQNQWTLIKQRAFESLEEHALKLAEQVGLENVSIDVEPGSPRQIIAEVAEQWQPDFIAMGAPRPSGINQIILGDVPTYIASHANCSILIVKRPGQGRKKKDDSGIKSALANVFDNPQGEERNEPPHAVTI